LNLAQSHKKHKEDKSELILCGLGALVATVFRSEAAEKITLVVTIEELKIFYGCFSPITFQTETIPDVSSIFFYTLFLYLPKNLRHGY
jgi:hypothetical protein